YRSQDFTKVVKDVDAVFDTVGGDVTTRSFAVLKSGGRLASIAVGGAAPASPRADVTSLRPKVDRDRRRLDRVAELVSKGAVPMPFEHLLAGLGACTSITLRMYAERHGWNIGAVDVSLALRRGDDGIRIERRVIVSAQLTREQQEKLAEVCEKTPVTLVVKSGAPVRTTLASADSAPPTPQ